MPIKSYLAHPYEGKKEALIEAIALIEKCDVIPASNEDVLVVVTETETAVEEEALKERLEGITSLRLLAMVSGFNNPKKN
ncbi:conserved hypothetical protein [Tenacibaculum maritimum]|uniref:hypothetical protein n=1 Tax=Tenacibaculum maritimum TaxID=107401 RepID=UPI0012E4F155|nr:hypothetical protein [Tenacibaculum maritimum]CAA0141544.1 conserved hypothetical protein [Tenacibaculum maritimum]CAA0141555.1 conserved hypothetical protein [Tenacibaculum maritimum]CAA0141568.1 conserved hypothetical protein [Tenacibaculum maritimum]